LAAAGVNSLRARPKPHKILRFGILAHTPMSGGAARLGPVRNPSGFDKQNLDS